MKNKEKIVIIIITAALATSTRNYVKIIQNGRRERAEIKAEGELQVKAISIAQARVIKKLNDGGFKGKMSLVNVLNDLKFETIAAREED